MIGSKSDMLISLSQLTSLAGGIYKKSCKSNFPNSPLMESGKQYFKFPFIFGLVNIFLSCRSTTNTLNLNEKKHSSTSTYKFFVFNNFLREGGMTTEECCTNIFVCC